MKHKPPHTLIRNRPPKKSLEDFYRWAIRLGHYHAHEAVERYRRIR